MMAGIGERDTERFQDIVDPVLSVLEERRDPKFLGLGRVIHLGVLGRIDLDPGTVPGQFLQPLNALVHKHREVSRHMNARNGDHALRVVTFPIGKEDLHGPLSAAPALAPGHLLLLSV